MGSGLRIRTTDPKRTDASTQTPAGEVTPEQPIEPTSTDRTDRASEEPIREELGPARAITASESKLRIRAPATIGIGNPQTDAAHHASDYAFVPRALGFALDSLAERHPEVNRNFGARILEYAAVFGGEVPWMVMSHEYGHYRAADAFGWNPQVKMTGWASGLTSYDVPASDRLAPDYPVRRLIAASAGVNQEQLNGAHMYSDWARNGGARYQEALGYLLAQTNTALYSMRTASLGDEAAASDDIANYVKGINARGHNLAVGHLVAMSVAADLASAPVWASLIGQGRFLALGDRNVEIPSLQLGRLEATLPNFRVMLSSDGPVIGARTLIGARSRIPIELDVDVRYDGGAAAIGAKAYDVPVLDRVRINPFIGASGGGGKNGLYLGTDLAVDVTDRVQLIGTAAYRADHLMTEPNGERDGFSMRLRLGLMF